MSITEVDMLKAVIEILLHIKEMSDVIAKAKHNSLYYSIVFL